MARTHHWIGLVVIGLFLTGCVPEEKYNAMKLRGDQLAEQVGQADADAKAARAESDAYKHQIEMYGTSDNTKGAQLANYQQQIANLTADRATLQAKLEEALSRPPTVNVVGGGGMLPTPLTNKLTEFAAANPDLVDFDAARGIVKFKSDVTFALGSTDLNAKAQAAVQRFAQILSAPEASSYELMVDGHTDNTPVTNEETRKRGNFDNWYLSAHRAISVAAELAHNGVNSSRIGVAGFADKRPIASNLSDAGKAQNRRVEILILPTTARASGMASGASQSPLPQKASERATRVPLNKDSAADERLPIVTK